MVPTAKLTFEFGVSDFGASDDSILPTFDFNEVRNDSSSFALSPVLFGGGFGELPARWMYPNNATRRNPKKMSTRRLGIAEISILRSICLIYTYYIINYQSHSIHSMCITLYL